MEQLSELSLADLVALRELAIERQGTIFSDIESRISYNKVTEEINRRLKLINCN